MIEIEAAPVGTGRRIGIAVSRFNEAVTRELLEGARQCLLSRGVAEDDIVVLWVPGAWELPAALGRLAATRQLDALIALGAVIRGDTPHFEYVAGGVTTGLAELGVRTGLPVIFGVLTTNDLEQAFERCGVKPGGTNKGWEAAEAALEMANLFERLAE